ncbi:MAG: hypothetical protein O3A51_10710, partial [Verrucomicrobia bacterium]|nr:hypothetical protein [Verrucomicrobiota bacterium]
MQLVDIGFLMVVGGGFLRARRRGLGFEVYKLLLMGIAAATGCGLYGLLRSVVSHLPFLNSASAGFGGFIGGISIATLLV